MDGARPVRAARGTTLTARSWQTEAPLRMLMNNLDPEVAERPGRPGRLRRHRARCPRLAAFDAIVRTLTTLREDETMLVQSGKPVGVLRTHEWAPRVLHRQLEPGRRLGDLARVPPAGGARPDDVRADDRRLLDLHRNAGHPAGHLRDVRRGRRQAIRRHAWPAPSPSPPAAAAWAARSRLAVTMNGGVCLIVDVDPARLRRRVDTATWTRSPTTSTTRSQALRQAKASRRPALGRLGRQLRGRPARTAAPRRRGRHRHRPDLAPTTRCPTCRGRRPGATGTTTRPSQAGGVHRPGPGLDGHARRGHGRIPGRRRRGLRLRQLHPRRGPAGRVRAGVRLPRLRAGLHPPAVLRGQGPVPLGRAVRRPGGHPRHRRGGPGAVPGQRAACTAGSALAREKVAFQGLPARICWLGYGERDQAGLRFNEMVADGERQRADRHRPRPPRLPARSPRRTGRPRRWPTAPTRSPTGRC